MIPSFLKVFIKRFSWLLLVYFLLRVLFLVWNWPTYSHSTWPDIFFAFWLGVRFDLAAICLTNALSFLLWLAPSSWWSHKWYRALDVTVFSFVNFVCIGVGVADAEFVKFIGKRTGMDLLMIHEDLERQLPSILQTYWYFPVIGMIFLFLFVRALPRFNAAAERKSWFVEIFWRFIVIALVFLAARGGFSLKPISPVQAYWSAQHELGVLTLNTPFNLIKTRNSEKPEHKRFFATDAEAILRVKKMTDLSRPPLAVAKKWNVVVVILESFATEFTGAGNSYQGYTPFFDSLARKSFYFKYNYANARRSIDGIPAVICGLPAMSNEPVITSDFVSNRFDCLPKLLTQAGYSSYFLHGAHNGSMHFDSFSNLAGFEHFVGLDEYPKGNPDDFDPYWGVLDEPMLQYAVKVIDEAKKPVMLGLFSLTSHHPYYIPPKYKGRFPKGDLEIHESIGYTDYSLRRFFETASTRPWFNNTIFVITADHTQKVSHVEYEDMLGHFRVPLLIYVPGLETGRVTASPDRITEHIDIVPSVLDLLGVANPDRLLVGQSVFDSGKPGRAFNYASGDFWYIEPEIAVQLAPQNIVTFKHSNTLDRKIVDKNSDPRFRGAVDDVHAIIQYMNEGLLNNSLYRWKESL